MTNPTPVRCAVCQQSNGLVINIIMANTSDPAPSGCALVAVPDGVDCDIGWTWDGVSTFTAPVG